MASDSRGPRFQSSHQQTFVSDIYLFTINCIEKMKMKKKWPGIAHYLENIFLSKLRLANFSKTEDRSVCSFLNCQNLKKLLPQVSQFEDVLQQQVDSLKNALCHLPLMGSIQFETLKETFHLHRHLSSKFLDIFKLNLIG